LIITFWDLSDKYDLNQFKDKSSSLYTFNFDNKIVWLTMSKDDTTMHFSSNSISDINIQLNEDMEKVQGWCTSNDMAINTMCS
jgi:hypothetical protein